MEAQWYYDETDAWIYFWHDGNRYYAEVTPAFKFFTTGEFFVVIEKLDGQWMHWRRVERREFKSVYEGIQFIEQYRKEL